MLTPTVILICCNKLSIAQSRLLVNLVSGHRVCLGVASQELVIVLHSDPDLVRIGCLPLIAQPGEVEVVDCPGEILPSLLLLVCGHPLREEELLADHGLHSDS